MVSEVLIRDRNFGSELSVAVVVVVTWTSPVWGAGTGMDAFGSPKCPERREFAGSPMAGRVGGLCTVS